VKRANIAAILASTLLAGAAPAARAQGLIADAQVGVTSFSASNSMKAVFDSSSAMTFGGRVGWVFGRGIYAAVSVRSLSKDGERVFVAEPSAPVFKLGHPLSMSLVPVDITVGYRFQGKRLFTPYVGLGGGKVSFEEKSTVGGVTEKESRSKSSWHVLGGVELGRGRLRLAAEALYEGVPDAIGVGGVSQVYGEKDLGGFTLLGKVVFAPR
jgi:opacity protein-like surface antigen